MDLFTLAAKLKLDSSDFEKGMRNAEKQGKGFADKLNRGFEKLGKTIKTTTKALTVGFGAAVAATVPVIKKAVSAYGNYQQLVGGVETLFKEASVFVLQDAKKAYREAGISANQYMEMATSFAASLMQGLGGDSVKAAEAANRAIIDMSDNANKMGTDIESIQNAYRGFSKQNFTMLDNLKLGYGGTKTEMERLLKDAEKLTGRKFDISNFADIVDAVHVIQVNMGIAGTTADEAASTITGSWGSVKASWEDLLVAMADPKGDVKAATQNFIESGKTMLGNVLPTIKQAISGLGDFIAEVAPMIAEELPGMIADFLPKFLKAGAALAKGIWKGLKSAWKKIDFKEIGNKLKTSIANFLKIDPDTMTLSSVVKTAFEKLRDWLKTKAGNIKLKFAELLDLGDDASWLDIARKVVNKIGEKFKGLVSDTKVKLAEMLGFVDDKGNVLEGTSWGEIGGKLIEKVKEGVKRKVNDLRITLAGLLGFTDANGKVLEDTTWGEIGKKMVEGITSAFHKGGTFLQKLILGDKYKEGESSWKQVGTELADWISEAFKEGGVLDTFIKNFADKVEGIATFIGRAVIGFSKWLDDPENLATISNVLTTIITAIANSLTKIVTPLANTIVKVLGDTDVQNAVIALAETVITTLWKLITEGPDVVKVGAGLYLGKKALDIFKLGKGIFGGGAKEAAKEATKSGGLWSAIKSAGSGMKTLLPALVDALPVALVAVTGAHFVDSLVQFFKGTAPGMVSQKEVDAYYSGIKDDQAKYESEEYKNLTKEVSALQTTLSILSEVQKDSGTAVEKLLSMRGTSDWTAIRKYAPEASRELANALKAVDEGWGDGMAVLDALQKVREELKNNVQIKINQQELQKQLDEENLTADVVLNPVFADVSSFFGFTPKAKGAWDIPYDNYPALLHRGERVLTASQARHQESSYGTAEIVGAIQSLRNDMQNLKLVVGRKTFGRAVVDYGGSGMDGYIGRSENKLAAGYGS